MHVMSYVGTLGMAAFHKKWASIVGTTLMAAIAVTGIGLSFAFGNPAIPLLGVTTGLTLDAATLSIASAAVPTNRGLSIASAVVGMMAVAANLVILGDTAVSGVSSLMAADATEGDISTGVSSIGAANTRSIETIKSVLRNKLHDFISYNTDVNAEVMRIGTYKQVNRVWKILQSDFFSADTKYVDKISALLMITRERATNTAIKLDDLANFFYELPNLHDADSGTFIQGHDFFSSNEIQLNKSIQYINNYKDFAFWNSSTENRFGYIIKIRRDVWNVYDLSDDPIKRITLRADNLYGNSPFRIHKIDQFFIFRFKYYQTIDPIDRVIVADPLVVSVVFVILLVKLFVIFSTGLDSSTAS